MRLTSLMVVLLLAALPGRVLADETELPGTPPPNSPPGTTVRVAGVVLKWVRGDKEANYRRAEPLIREAAKGGARIVCTTECFLDGYAIADKTIPLDQYRALGEPIPTGKYYRRLADLARELKIHLVAGLLEADGDARYNTAVLLGPNGDLLGKYRKQKLGHELVRNTPGRDAPVFVTPYGRGSLMICADRTEPDLVRRFRANGADFLLCPSGGMFGPKSNDPIVQARSRENRIPIVFVHPAEFLVTAPDGSILARTILGDSLLVTREQIGGDRDQNRVFYFDLPVRSEPAPALDCQAERANPVTYDVDFSAVVTAPAGTKRLRVWLPLPPSDRGQEVSGRDLSTFPTPLTPRIEREKVFGNEFASFEFDNPQGGQVIRHRFRIKVWELNWNVDPEKVRAVERWPAGFDPYLKGDRSVVVDDRFRDLARAVVPEPTGSARDLGAIFSWLQANLRYDPVAASRRASSEHALTKRVGDCGDYHGLCAAVGRVLGFPTRVVYGLHAFPKNSPSHCKLEAYLPPYGWVSFDVSETQKLIAEIRNTKERGEGQREELVRAATARLRRGFRDNTWFLQTRGTDYELAPPAGRRVPVVRTLYAEADGVALPDPNPSDPAVREFAWMTMHRYTPDRAASYPFKDWKSLENR